MYRRGAGCASSALKQIVFHSVIYNSVESLLYFSRKIFAAQILVNFFAIFLSSANKIILSARILVLNSSKTLEAWLVNSPNLGQYGPDVNESIQKETFSYYKVSSIQWPQLCITHISPYDCFQSCRILWHCISWVGCFWVLLKQPSQRIGFQH